MNLTDAAVRVLNHTFNYTIANSTIVNPGKAWAPIVVPIFFAVLLFAGIFGNVIIIYIILRHRYMQITPNLYIMNLAIGDLLLLVFSAPFTALTYLLDTYPFGILMCKIDQASQNLTLGVTIFTLMALSYDRCISIRDPIFVHTNKANRTRRSRIGITLIWTMAILFCIPDGMFSTIVNQPYKLAPTLNLTTIGDNYNYTAEDFIYIQVCYPFYKIDHDNPPIYMKIRVILRFIFYFLIPILIIGTFYILIIVVLLRPFNFANTVENLTSQTIEEESVNSQHTNSINNANTHYKINKEHNNTVKESPRHHHNRSRIKKQNSNNKTHFMDSYYNRSPPLLNKKPFKKKQLSLNSVYINTHSDTSEVELKCIKHNYSSSKSSNSSHSRKIDSVSSMRSTTANYIVNRRHMKARLKIVKMVLFLVVIFVLFCLPEHIYYLIWYFTRVNFNQGLLLFRILSSCAFYAHASIHAYVLFCLSSKFRYYGQNLLMKCNERLFSKHNTLSTSLGRPKNIQNIKYQI